LKHVPNFTTKGLLNKHQLTEFFAMRPKSYFCIAIALTLFLAGCYRATPEGKIHVTLLQINDVYEIEPVSGGKLGGLARVAAVRNQLIKENPNTFTVIAGDFFSPSALGTAESNGKLLDGKQMIAVLNAMELDYATFGNHEFDLKEESFLERVDESEFTWISSNVFDATGKPFPQVKTSDTIEITGKTGETFTIGLVGVTLNDNKKSYVSYKDPFTSLKREVQALETTTDAIVAITHLDSRDDMELAKQIPELSLIIGGHDHENMYFRRGKGNTPIAKADANAKSVFIHRMSFDPKTKSLEIQSTLLTITDQIAEDPTTKTVVDAWLAKGFEGFRKIGFDPAEVVAVTDVDLDGLEASVRSGPTNLTRLVADAMLEDADKAELAIFNSGSIRIDDLITAGQVTQYDVIRVLPFPGKILTVSIQGNLLQKALSQASNHRSKGSFLQTTSNVTRENNQWMIDGIPLDPDKFYRVAINDFLAKGGEKSLSYLDITNPNSGIKLISSQDDIRKAVIKKLKNRFPVSPTK
jgi:5'-nucleotidase / UDP-sugar diphosphatase